MRGAGERCDDAITALWKDGLAERISSGRSIAWGTEALALSLLGAPLDGMSAGYLWESSGGNNVLFIRREAAAGRARRRIGVTRIGDVSTGFTACGWVRRHAWRNCSTLASPKRRQRSVRCSTCSQSAARSASTSCVQVFDEPVLAER